MASEKMRLVWGNHSHNIGDLLKLLFYDDSLADCTLSFYDGTIKTHKMMLSACSPYFQKIFKDNPCKHPVIILRGVSYKHMNALIEYMYRGVIEVSASILPELLLLASDLKIKGFENYSKQNRRFSEEHTPETQQTNTNLELTEETVAVFNKEVTLTKVSTTSEKLKTQDKNKLTDLKSIIYEDPTGNLKITKENEPSLNILISKNEKRSIKEEQLSCKICNKQWKTKRSWKKHMINMHTNVGRVSTKRGRFNCEICNKTFGVERSLKSHYLRRHNKNLYKKNHHSFLSTQNENDSLSNEKNNEEGTIKVENAENRESRSPTSNLSAKWLERNFDLIPIHKLKKHIASKKQKTLRKKIVAKRNTPRFVKKTKISSTKILPTSPPEDEEINVVDFLEEEPLKKKQNTLIPDESVTTVIKRRRGRPRKIKEDDQSPVAAAKWISSNRNLNTENLLETTQPETDVINDEGLNFVEISVDSLALEEESMMHNDENLIVDDNYDEIQDEQEDKQDNLELDLEI